MHNTSAETKQKRSLSGEEKPAGGLRHFSYEIIGDTLFMSTLAAGMNMYNVSEFLEETDQAFIGLDFSSVILDIHNLVEIDGTAIGALMVAIGRMRSRRNGGELVLVSGNYIHKRILSFVESKVKVFHTRDEALDYFKGKEIIPSP